MAMHIATHSRAVSNIQGALTAQSDCRLSYNASSAWPFSVTFSVIDTATRSSVTGIWVHVHLQHSTDDGNFGSTIVHVDAPAVTWPFWVRNHGPRSTLKFTVGAAASSFQNFSCVWPYPIAVAP